MAPSFFLTGISGYIGGQFLYKMIQKHPDYQITGLVRKEEQRQEILSLHPSVNILIGDLESIALIEEESSKADVVLEMADGSHVPLLTAIFSGIKKGKKNAAFIQLSGAASIMDSSLGYGQPSPKVWDDIADYEELVTFDQKTHFHAFFDQLILAEGKKGMRTVVFAPPMIYGKGDGIKKWSYGMKMLADAIQKRGRSFKIGEAKNVVSGVHVKDIADMLLFFAEDALEEGGKVEWGERGYYFADTGEYVFGDLVDAVTKEMYKRGLIESEEIDSITAEEANVLRPWASIIFGTNMRTRGSRLKALGWKLKREKAFETINDMLD